MSNSVVFKKPTIKATSRAYVRLFGYFTSSEKWLDFLAHHRIEYVPFGIQRNGDCSVRVINTTTGAIAILGLDVPNEIKYHSHIATGRSFWTEDFLSASHKRHKVSEVGFSKASDDVVTPL